MTFEEKRAWVMLVTSVVAYLVYLTVVLGRLDGGPLADVSYVGSLLWTVGLTILANIVINIALGIASPREAQQKDERDREIWRFGDHVGQSFVVIGAVAAMIMAMLELDYFWIANAVYLCFALSAILGSIAKVIAYRRGFQPW
jgi:membrane glycosyltransferase